MASTNGIWEGSEKLKFMNRIHEFSLWSCYIKGVPQKKQYHYFFGEALRIAILN